MEGSGSLWNKNSWHWEEKNYTKWGKEWIESKLLDHEIPVPNVEGGEITINKIEEIKGDASISIRKQKQIHVFTWEITLKYMATGVENVNSEGTIHIHEFGNDDIDDIDLTHKVDKSSDLATDAFREEV